MDWIAIIEGIGLVAFAWAGAMVAIERKMELLGIIIISSVTATGGGIVRDLFLGLTPPTCLANQLNLWCISAGVILGMLMPRSRVTELMILICDTLGLGAFVCVGANLAINSNCNLFTVVLMGTLTGTVGGMMRDVLVGNSPRILYRDGYLVIAIMGALIYLVQYLYTDVSVSTATLVTIIMVFLLRWVNMTSPINNTIIPPTYHPLALIRRIRQNNSRLRDPENIPPVEPDIKGFLPK